MKVEYFHSHIRIVRAYELKTNRQVITGIPRGERLRESSEKPSRAILQCNYLSPTITPSFPQVSPFAPLLAKILKFNEPEKKRESPFRSLSKYPLPVFIASDRAIRIIEMARDARAALTSA